MKKIILFGAMAIILSGCATGGFSTKPKYPNQVTSEIQASFNAADSLYKSGQFDLADAAFAKFISANLYTELTDEARFRRGEIAYAKKNFSDAIVYYRQSISEIISPDIAPKALLKTALSLRQLKKPAEALDEIKKINRKSSSPILRMRADSLAVRATRDLGLNDKDALVWYLFLLDDYAQAGNQIPTGIPPTELINEANGLSQVKAWVDDKTVTEEEIRVLPLKDMKGKRSGGYAAYKYALVLHSQGDTKATIKQLKSYVTTYPNHEYYGQATLLMGELGGVIGSGAGVTVGVILPLSGKYAEYGESVLHGIECAAGVYDPCFGPAGMKIIVRDSETTQGGVVGAVDELAAENVAAIIGPLTSKNAIEAVKRAQELGVPMISIAQVDEVTNAGDYIFRNSISDSSDMHALAKYAIEKMNLKRFFVVYTPSKKSMEYKSLFSKYVIDLGGSVVASKPFEPKQAIAAADELRGRGAVELQAEEERAEGVDFTPTGVAFDALFVPDSLMTAVYVMSRLSPNVAEQSRLLGTSRFDDVGVASRAGPYAEGAVFPDSFFKQSTEEPAASFISKFKSAYGIDPTMLEALGYDSMRIISSSVEKKGAVHRESIRNALAKTSGFAGVTGKLSFNNERNVVREPWMLMIKHGSIVPAK